MFSRVDKYNLGSPRSVCEALFVEQFNDFVTCLVELTHTTIQIQVQKTNTQTLKSTNTWAKVEVEDSRKQVRNDERLQT